MSNQLLLKPSSSSIVSTLIRATSVPIFHDKWISCDNLCVALSIQFDLQELRFDSKELNKALRCNKHLTIQMDMNTTSPVMSDHIGIFRQKYRPKVRDHSKKGSAIFAYYFVSTKGTIPQTTTDRWFDNICDLKDLLVNTRTIHSKRSLDINSVLSKKQKIEKTPPVFLGKNLSMTTEKHYSNINKKEACYATASTLMLGTVHPEEYSNYWDSSEATKLFKPFPNENNARAAVVNQIVDLTDSMDHCKGYLTLIDRSDEIQDGSLSEHLIWVTRQKIQMLIIALDTALKQMPVIKNWDECCKKAVSIAEDTPGMRTIKSSRTIRNWYKEFRDEGRKFSAKPYLTESKLNLPHFLSEHPEVCLKVQQYARENLGEMSIELMWEYFHDTVLPKLVKEKFKVSKDDTEYKVNLKIMLNEYGLTNICPITVYRWMINLGFRYKERRKGYYVDGHERPATIEYRNKFVKRYLQYEQRMFRWIQITKARSDQLANEKIIPENSGYAYNDSNGDMMVEHHVDSCSLFQDEMNNETIFGGNLSVRKPQNSKPLIIWGHDECIFKQYLLTKKIGRLLMGK